MRAPLRSHLLNGTTVDDYRRSVADGVDRVAARLAATDRPFTGATADDLTPLFDKIDLDDPLGDTSAALDELTEVYLRDAVWFHHPRYLAHLNCPVVIPAVVGEAVLSAVNSSLDTWDQSAGGTLIERRLIDWTAGRIGLGPAADGIFTSGGTQSNLQALLLAREEALEALEARQRARAQEAREEQKTHKTQKAQKAQKCHLRAGGAGGRTEDSAGLCVLASEAAHFSVRKAAKLLGLGPDQVVSVPCDRNRRMQPFALASQLQRCADEQLVPMAVVATAGTTDFGSLDPLPEIADLCTRHGVWLHVDAAYGCGLLASPTRRHLLDGIERADSVTVDYHKSFFQPVSSSALLVRDAAVLRHATYHADYLNPRHAVRSDTPNQVDKSLQTTRRFDALKLWMTLRIMGADAVGTLFDEVCDLAAEGWRMLAADPRFEVVTAPVLSTLVFRWVPPGTASAHRAAPASAAAPVSASAAVATEGDVCRANLHARRALSASGAAVVAGTVVDGRHHLKFTLLNPETTAADIAAVLDLIAAHAEQYLGDDLDRAC